MIINVSKIKKELLVLLVCLLAAFGLNIFSIVTNNTSWSEFVGQMHIVVLVAILLYVLVGLFRMFAWGINRLFKNK